MSSLDDSGHLREGAGQTIEPITLDEREMTALESAASAVPTWRPSAAH